MEQLLMEKSSSRMGCQDFVVSVFLCVTASIRSISLERISRFSSLLQNLVVCIAILGLPISSSAQDTDTPDFLSNEVIAVHGGFITNQGSPYTPSIEVIFEFTEEIIEKNKSEKDDPIRARIIGTISDPILSNITYIEWLVNRRSLQLDPHAQTLLMTLRSFYLHKEDPSRLANSRGLTQSEIRSLVSGDLFDHEYFTRDSVEYISECLDAGVPVPNGVFTNEWESLGSYSGQISNIPGSPRLWVHYSDEPYGACVAVSFERSGPDHLDMICFGTQSKNACFFELDGHERSDGVVPTTSMVDGYSSELMGQCTDCHSGENPYIVHPDKSGFRSIVRSRLHSGDWHTSLVDPSWIQAGPTDVLDTVSSEARCSSCHWSGNAGRFPELSQAQRGYCSMLRTIVGRGDNSGLRTMPPNGATYQDINKYNNHIEALLQSCNNPRPDPGTIVRININDDPNIISPPTIFSPIFACLEGNESESSDIFSPSDNVALLANSESGAVTPTDFTLITLSGVILGADVSLHLDGREISRRDNVREIDSVVLLADVEPGDVVVARQEYNGVSSQASTPVEISRISFGPIVPFPPPPAVRPETLHECSATIGATVIPNSTIESFINGESDFKFTAAANRVYFPAGKQFETGDDVSLRAEICGFRSPISVPVTVVEAPTFIPTPELIPEVLFDGQELVSFRSLTYGAQTSLEVIGEPDKVGFSTPYNRRDNVDVATRIGRPLTASDRYIVKHSLCEASSISRPIAHETNCADLLPPEIETPRAGNNFVIPRDAVPGARVRVYDRGRTEIGDSSGQVINLTRTLLHSDQLLVTQQVGNCQSRRSFRIDVQ